MQLRARQLEPRQAWRARDRSGFSDEAVAFARNLSRESGIAANFVESEVVSWMMHTTERFDVAFSSYGATPWLPDLGAWAEGVHRVLDPGGRFVYVEFHPVLWSIGEGGSLSGDDYFRKEPFHDPVSDYVGNSKQALGAVTAGVTMPNEVPATSYQHTLAELVTALVSAGLVLERLEEYPHSNGCKVHSMLVPAEGRRWVWPEGTTRLPLMFGLSARKAR